MASPPRLPFFDVNTTLGANLIGFSVSSAVFGIFSMQCWSYYRRYPQDRPVYKALVAIIWILELIHQIFIGHVTYFATITNFTNPLALLLGPLPWTLVLQQIIGALVGTIVKLCFTMRVWRFSSRNIFVTGAILLLVLTQFGFAIAYGIRALELNKFVLAGRLKLIASLSLGLGTLADIITALALAFFLRKLRTGYRKSDSLVNSLTVYAINTGAVTSAFSICTLILYDTNPENFLFVAVYYVLSKLYAISLLATLNTRKIVRGRGTDRQGGTTGATAVSAGTANVHGNTFYMVNHSRARSMGDTTQVQSNSYQTKSGLEIGVHQEVSVVSDVENEANLAQLSYDEQGYRRTYPGWR